MIILNAVNLFHRNVRLVPYNNEHNEKTVAWLNDPALQHSFGLSSKVTIESHTEWLSLQKDFLLWAILDKENSHVGNVSLQLTLKHHSAYFQIYLGNESARGSGIGWSSLICVINYAFQCLDINRIWLHTFPDNIIAINLYKKAGFTQEGIEREAIFRGGCFNDQLRWSLLKREWGLKSVEVIQ